MERASEYNATAPARGFSVLIYVFAVWYGVGQFDTAMARALLVIAVISLFVAEYLFRRRITVRIGEERLHIVKGNKKESVPLSSIHGLQIRRFSNEFAFSDAKGTRLAQLPANWPYAEVLEKQLRDTLQLSERKRISTPFATGFFNYAGVFWALGALVYFIAPYALAWYTDGIWSWEYIRDQLAVTLTLIVIMLGTVHYFHWSKIRYINLGETALTVVYPNRRVRIKYKDIKTLERQLDPSVAPINKIEELLIHYGDGKMLWLRKLPVDMERIEQRLKEKAGLDQMVRLNGSTE